MTTRSKRFSTIAAAMAGMALSAYVPFADFNRTPVTRTVSPHEEVLARRKGKRLSGKQLAKLKGRQINRSGYLANLAEKMAQFKNRKKDKMYQMIQGMTNWRNHQWLKAGGKRELDVVEHFYGLQKVQPNE